MKEKRRDSKGRILHTGESDFTPIIGPTLDGWLLTVTPPASGVTNFRGVTGGVYKARERIHRSMLTCDY